MSKSVPELDPSVGSSCDSVEMVVVVQVVVAPMVAEEFDVTGMRVWKLLVSVPMGKKTFLALLSRAVVVGHRYKLFAEIAQVEIGWRVK